MTISSLEYSCYIFVFIVCLDIVTGTCSWSNEHCSKDSQCCSSSCYRAFEGTNPRCRHSALSEKCIFSFHCADDLECGPKFNCCSPYWKMCTKTSDCCDPLHVCKPADGFYYDRCLYPNSAIRDTNITFWTISSIFLHLVIVFVGIVFTTRWR